jgi:hypothetical protein
MCIMTRLNTLLLLVSLLLSSGAAFQPTPPTVSSTSANSILRFRPNPAGGAWGTTNTALSVIIAEEMDFERDIGRGGVRLAQESAVKMTGRIKYKAGVSATPVLQELIRYTTVTALEEQSVKDQLQSMGATIVCTGQGKEVYADPGTTAEVNVDLAPAQAVRAALTGAGSAGSAMACDKLVINVAGGDDLQVKEVIDALEELVMNLDVPSNANIIFNSLSHASFPMLAATVTAVALAAETTSDDKKGAEKSVAEGEVYFSEGKWYTVVQEDINTAVA